MPNTNKQTFTGRWQHGMLIGPPKSGKTQFIGTWPNLYVFDFDDGLATLYGNGNDVYYHTYRDSDPNVPIAFKQAEDRLKMALTSARANGKVLFDTEKDEFVIEKVTEVKAPIVVIETIAIDGASEMLNSTMKFTQASRGAQHVPNQSDWFPQMAVFQGFVERALTLPCHVWLVCHDKIKEIMKGDINLGTRVLPALTGSLALQMGGKFDLIFRAVNNVIGGKPEFKLQAMIQGIYEAGHRYGDAFGLFISPPTYPEIMKNLDEYAKRKAEILKRMREEQTRTVTK